MVCTNSRAATGSNVVLPSSPMKTTAEKLRSLLAERALIVGPIVLSNGSLSNHYFDCKMVTLNSEGAELVGDAVLDVIQRLPEKVKAIGGLTHGADPIIGAVMMRARDRGLSLDGFYVRQEPKKHGTRKLVENAPPKGTNVVIVDDVVTAGGSVLKALAGAELEGCKVVAVIALVDRLEGGGEKISARVGRYITLYTLEDFRLEIEACQPIKKSELLSEEVSR
jgi:orotate phosphoribosyltransferase